MLRAHVVSWGMLLVGLVFVLAAVWPLLDRRPVSIAFLGIGAVFVVLGFVRRRRRAADQLPPAQ